MHVIFGEGCYISKCISSNKLLGQTLSTAGIFMTDQVFSHGQMYVALSRSTSTGVIKMLTLDSAFAGQPTQGAECRMDCEENARRIECYDVWVG